MKRSDITRSGQQQLRLRLSRSHRQLWRLSETNIIGVYSSDLEGHIYDANDYVLRLLGYTRDELEKGELTWIRITPPEYLPIDYAEIERVKASGASSLYQKEYFRKDGSRVPILIAFAAVEGTTGQYICFIIDQTEQVRAMREMTESEDRFRSTFEQAAIGVAHVASDGTWVRTNLKLREIAGYAGEEEFPSHLNDLLRSEDVPAMSAEVEALYERQTESFSVETLLKRKDGSPVWTNLTGSLLRDEAGRPKYLVLMVQDITDRKGLQASLQEALQRAEEGNRAKTEFLANMSHELRTPLSGVLGMIELVLGMALEDEPRTLLEVARTSGKSMLRLVQDLLEFSRMEAGRLPFENRPFDVDRCVASAVDVIALEARKKNLTLSTTIDPSAPASICCDEGRVRQVLVNLLGNAVKFTDHGEIAIHVALDERGMLLICVSDTGIGIAKDKVDQLFQMFYQVDSKVARKYGGTGLGLALSRHIVEKLGGRMWVESREGEGSTFCFTLPLEGPAPEATTPAGSQE